MFARALLRSRVGSRNPAFRSTPQIRPTNVRLFSTKKKNQPGTSIDPLDTIGAMVDQKLVSVGDRDLTPIPVEQSLENVAYIKPRLSDIVRLELFEEASPEMVSAIWKEYHLKKYCISAVIPEDVYNKFTTRAEKYPVFVIPIPKEQGAMFYVMQYSEDTFSFISLIQYQLYQSQDDPANAPPALITRHYTELLDSKKVVLMRGQIDPVQIDVHEAQLLMNQFQLYYLDNDRLHLVKKFNERPREFDYNELLNFVLPNKIF